MLHQRLLMELWLHQDFGEFGILSDQFSMKPPPMILGKIDIDIGAIRRVGREVGNKYYYFLSSIIVLLLFSYYRHCFIINATIV
mmetsp:Transcript_29892/g.34078  ORF Transcript_29892/g.34078 Transcript_29892/m.34078 type:complete len:84 (+) Transcript_29892:115-366(+)